jgi:hypothetical protein
MSPQIDETTTPGLIKNYLDKRDDFDLKLYVLRSLKDRGWVAEHSGSYVDPIKQEVRQFDVSAWKPLAKDCSVFISAECKNISPRYPLVLSTVPREYEEAHHDVMWSTEEALSDRGTEAPANRMNVAHQPSCLYSEAHPVGKSASQPDLEKDGKAPADESSYSKWSQAIAASGSKLASIIDFMLEKGDHYAFVLPILIVSDATLWTVHYDATGARSEPRKADQATLWVDRIFDTNLSVKYLINHLQICTRSGFEIFLNGLAHPDMLDRIFDPVRRSRLRGA